MTTSNPGVPERDPRSCFQILSLDGGGLRGLFSSAVLAELESDLGMSMVDHFDLIVGTSTGGLVALGLGAGRRPGELVEFYVTDGPRVFKGGRGRIRNARRPKHSPTALRAALEAVFGDRTLGSSARPLVVPAYSLDTQDVYLFKTDHHPRLTSRLAESSMVDVAMATTAAPTLLPAPPELRRPAPGRRRRLGQQPHARGRRRGRQHVPGRASGDSGAVPRHDRRGNPSRCHSRTGGWLRWGW